MPPKVLVIRLRGIIGVRIHVGKTRLLNFGTRRQGSGVLNRGVNCKGRIDALCDTPMGVCLLDLKTSSRSLSVDDLVRTCANYGYVEQLALYLRLCTECGINVHRVMIDRGVFDNRSPERLFDDAATQLVENEGAAAFINGN